MRYLVFAYNTVNGETSYKGDFAAIPGPDPNEVLSVFELTDKRDSQARILARRFNFNLDNINL